jgi:hypothetical protein
MSEERDPMDPTTEKKQPTFEERIDDLTLKVDRQRQLLDRTENQIRMLDAALGKTMGMLQGTAKMASIVLDFLDWKFGERWDRGARKEYTRRVELGNKRLELLDKARKAYDLDEQEKTDVVRELHELARELGTMIMDVREVVLLYTNTGDVAAAVDYLEEVRSQGVPPEIESLVEQLLYRCQDLAEKAGDESLKARAAALMKPGN